MDIINLIRSFIFFTAGLFLIIFSKQIIKIHCKIENFLVKKLHINFIRFYTIHDEKKLKRTNIIISTFLFIISAILFIYSVNN